MMSDNRSAMDDIALLTVTWSGDLAHFRLLRESLKRSALAGCRHRVIVQDEDLSQFSALQEEGMTLESSAQVLPPEVEQRRRRARRLQRLAGRRMTTVSGSLARRFGWPRWVRYTGWHTQQLCKLAAVADDTAPTVVALDSDVIITPHARVDDFRSPRPGVIRCHEDWQPVESLSRKTAHWQATARKLLDLDEPDSKRRDVYYDTPFILDRSVVRALLTWLESRYGQPWWQVLLDCPPRQWSEFGLYRAWLRNRYDGPVEWLDRSRAGYLYDASDARRLVRAFASLVHEQRCHYVTVHSQAGGRHDWHPDDYGGELLDVLSGDQPSVSGL